VILRDGVLAGVRLTVHGRGEFATATRDRAVALGAIAAPPPATLVVDASGSDGPREALDGTWDVIQPASAAMIETGGQIVVLAPRPGSVAAEASRAGLENLSRTLSVEWSRYSIRPVTILPGTGTSPAEVAELVAFLASGAGSYYAGCAFTLGSVS
jgi:NAD(P)-dependent dehydrogenase (short-subunit alcohol dehydrogenase family)